MGSVFVMFGVSYCSKILSTAWSQSVLTAAPLNEEKNVCNGQRLEMFFCLWSERCYVSTINVFFLLVSFKSETMVKTASN